jgi:hypothetical protein
MLSVIPCHNLISNIGFGSGATHTVGRNRGFPLQAMVNPLSHPQWIIPDPKFDAAFSRRCSDSLAAKVRARLGRWKNLLEKSETEQP